MALETSPTLTGSRQTYQVKTVYFVIGIIFLVLCSLAWPGIILYWTLTDPVSASADWFFWFNLVTEFILIGVGLLAFGTIAGSRLVVAPEGLEYHTVGYSIRTGWDNLEKMGLVWTSWAAAMEGVVLKESAAKVSGWLEAFVIAQPLVIILSLFGGHGGSGGLNRGFTRVIPVQMFARNWQYSQLKHQIQQYAPQVFEQAGSETANPVSWVATTSYNQRPQWLIRVIRIGLPVAGLVFLGLVFLSSNVSNTKAQAVLSTPSPYTNVDSVAFSPDGKYFATDAGSRSVIIWDATTHQEVRQINTLNRHNNSLAFSPDGKILASGGEVFSASPDRVVAVQLSEVASGQALQSLSAPVEVNSIAFSPDGKFIAAGGGVPKYSSTKNKDYSVRVWNVADGNLVTTLKDATDVIEVVAFSPDGKTLVSAGNDYTIRFYEVGSWQPLRNIELNFEVIYGMAFSPDGKNIAVGTLQGRLLIYDASSGNQIEERQVTRGSKRVGKLAYSPDGKTIGVVAGDNLGHLISTTSYKTFKTLVGDKSTMNSLAFSPDGKTIVIGSDGSAGSNLRIWNFPDK